MGICYASYGFALYGKVRLTINLYDNSAYKQRVVDEQPFYLYRLNEDSSTTKFDYKFENMVVGTRTYTINALLPSGDYFYMNDDGLKLGTIKNNGEIDDIAFSYTVNKNMMYNISDIIKSDVVVNETPDYASVLYYNGKLIINEPKENRAMNKAANGNGIVNIYPAYLPSTNYAHEWINDNNYRNSIRTAKFDTYTKPTTCKDMFKQCQNLTSVDLSNLDTTISESFFGMFESCYELVDLDIDLLKVTSNATVISGIFNNCRKLVINSDLEHWDTSNVTNFGVAFSNIANTHFSPKLDTSSGESFNAMFGYSSKYEVLDLSTFDTSSATNFHFMFYWCDHLTTIYAKPTFVQPTGVEANNMFGKCDVLVGGAGTVWDAAHIGLDRAYIDQGASRPGYFTNKDTITYHTVLYADGTLIINEPSDMRTANTHTHGAMRFEYDPLDANHDYVFTSDTQLPWYYHITDIRHFEIGSAVKPVSTAYWFAGALNCESIDHTNLDTSLTTSMKHMYSANPTPTIDLSSLDTSHVTDFEGMLSSLSVTTLDVSGFDTTNATNMCNMFAGSSQITSLDVSNFDTSNVTNFEGMFTNMMALETLDITGIDTSSAETLRLMFAGCYKLPGVDVSNFVTTNVTNINEMFESLGSMASTPFTLDCSNFDTSNVTTMFNVFGSSAATSYDVSTWDTSNVTNMSNMFNSLKNATELDLTSFDTSKVTNMEYMFYASNKLVTIKSSDTFNTGLVSQSSNMFTQCTSIVGGAGTTYSSVHTDKVYARIDNPPSSPGYFKGTAKTVGKTTLYTDGTFIINEYVEDRAANIALHGAVTNEYTPLSTSNPYVFTTTLTRPWNSQRTSIKSVEFGSPVSPTSMAYWFAQCSQLTSFNSTNLDTSNVTDMSFTFNGCSAIRNLDLSTWDVSGVTNFDTIFDSCSKLISIDLSTWDVSNAEVFGGMFYRCSSLKTIDLSSFVTTKANNCKNMFSSCSNLITIFATNNITFSSLSSAQSQYMFDGCTKLVGGLGTIYYTSNPNDSRYAKLDEGTSNPGYFTNKELNATYLFNDGVFSINLNNVNRPSYIESHSGINNIYKPLDSTNTYVFSSANARPWNSQRTSIKSVEFGSPVSPTSMAYWFAQCSQLTSFNSTNLDTSNVTSLHSLFYSCSSITSLDLTSFVSTNINFMVSLFGGCSSLTTIYAENNFATNVTYTDGMFTNCTSIVGGAGTTYDSSKTNKEYARIDNPPSEPGYFTAKP